MIIFDKGSTIGCKRSDLLLIFLNWLKYTHYLGLRLSHQHHALPKKVSFGNILMSECRPNGRTFIEMKGGIGHETNTCGTLALIFCHFDDWPLRTTLWYLFCKKYSIRLKRLPSILLFLSLCRQPLCKILSLWIKPGKSHKLLEWISTKTSKNIVCNKL